MLWKNLKWTKKVEKQLKKSLQHLKAGRNTQHPSNIFSEWVWNCIHQLPLFLYLLSFLPFSLTIVFLLKNLKLASYLFLFLYSFPFSISICCHSFEFVYFVLLVFIVSSSLQFFFHSFAKIFDPYEKLLMWIFILITISFFYMG